MKYFVLTVLMMNVFSCLVASQLQQTLPQKTLRTVVFKKFIDIGEVGKSLNAKMFHLIKEGNLEEIQKMFIPKIIPDKDAKIDGHGSSALKMAVQYGHEDIVKYLISLEVDVNAPCSHGATPLMSAKTLSITKLLVDAGADIHAQASNGCTAFARAKYFGWLDIADFLKSKGAETDIPQKVVEMIKAHEAAKTARFMAQMEYTNKFPLGNVNMSFDEWYAKRQYRQYLTEQGYN